MPVNDILYPMLQYIFANVKETLYAIDVCEKVGIMQKQDYTSYVKIKTSLHTQYFINKSLNKSVENT